VVVESLFLICSNMCVQTSAGRVLNIMANDLQSFERLPNELIYAVVAPLQTVVVMVILWQYVGIASLAGLFLVLLFILFQCVMSRFFEIFRRATTYNTDKRIKLMSELIGAMKLIKMYCWEKPFSDLVSEVREREVNSIKQRASLQGLNMAFAFEDRTVKW